MGIELRRATPNDKPRILEISAQVWEGTDYVPLVLDRWLADTDGELLVALIDDVVAGFAHRVYLAPGYAWLEGARTDVAYRGRGAARAIAHRFLDDLRREGADRIGLSTHITNEASLHLIRANGFREVAWFTNVAAENAEPSWPLAEVSKQVAPVSLEEAREYVRRSRSLAVGRGFAAHGWTFYPFERAPEAALRHSPHLLGIRERGELAALVVAGYPTRSAFFPIHFLEGSDDAAETLLRHALHLAAGCRYVDLMAPGGLDSGLPCVRAADKLGLKPWATTTPDVFVFERAP